MRPSTNGGEGGSLCSGWCSKERVQEREVKKGVKDILQSGLPTLMRTYGWRRTRLNQMSQKNPSWLLNTCPVWTSLEAVSQLEDLHCGKTYFGDWNNIVGKQCHLVGSFHFGELKPTVCCPIEAEESRVRQAPGHMVTVAAGVGGGGQARRKGDCVYCEYPSPSLLALLTPANWIVAPRTN